MNENINWKKLRGRSKYVAIHTGILGLFAGLTALVYLVAGILPASLFAGYLWLKAKEFGELMAKEKQKPDFVNDAKTNLRVLGFTFKDLWILAQAEGALVLAGLLCFAVKLAF